MEEKIIKRIQKINSGIVPDGYKKTKVGIVPAEWEVEHIGKHLEEYRELSNDIEKYPVYSSSRKGLIPQSDYYDKEAVQTNLGYKIVPVGYVTYRHMSDDDIFHFNLNSTNHDVLVSSEYPVFNAKKSADLYYIITSLNEMNRFRYFCRSQKMGGTRTRLYFKNLSTYRMAFPSLPEQQKIAEILSTQDKLIELQEKKIEQLKELKKGYLQKMFPKKGSKYPELRFKGFTDAWEQRKLGELANVKDSARISNDLWSDSGVPYIRASDLSNNDLSGVLFISEETYSFYKNQTGAPILGDLLFNGGGEIGKAVLKRDDKPIYVQGGAVLYVQTSSATELVGEYLESYFQSPLAKKYIDIASAGGTMKHFTLGPSQEMPIIYPSLDEQRKIGDYFRKLDHLITLHQRKLEQEKQKKKALMQLLLTGKVRCI